MGPLVAPRSPAQLTEPRSRRPRPPCILASEPPQERIGVAKSCLRTQNPWAQPSPTFSTSEHTWPVNIIPPTTLWLGLEHSATLEQILRVSHKKRMSGPSFHFPVPWGTQISWHIFIQQRENGRYLARGYVRATWLPKRVDTHHRTSPSLWKKKNEYLYYPSLWTLIFHEELQEKIPGTALSIEEGVQERPGWSLPHPSRSLWSWLCFKTDSTHSFLTSLYSFIHNDSSSSGLSNLQHGNLSAAVKATDLLILVQQRGSSVSSQSSNKDPSLQSSWTIVDIIITSEPEEFYIPIDLGLN